MCRGRTQGLSSKIFPQHQFPRRNSERRNAGRSLIPQRTSSTYSSALMFMGGQAHRDNHAITTYFTVKNIPSCLDLGGYFRAVNDRLAENYVQQQLPTMGVCTLHYWTSGNTAEVDFVIQSEELILPLE